MPVNRKYNLAVLMEACEYYVSKKKQRLTLEYILIEGLNDRPEDARALASLAATVLVVVLVVDQFAPELIHLGLWRTDLGLGNIGVPHVAAAVVGFYFGSRS